MLKFLMKDGVGEGLSGNQRKVARTGAWSFVRSLFPHLKKRTQEAWLPRDLGGGEGVLGARMHGQALLTPSCPTRDGEGTGHRLTDSRTLSRAHGSRINNFIYTLHTVQLYRQPGTRGK